MKKGFTVLIIGIFLVSGLVAQDMPPRGPKGPFNERPGKENCISEQPYYQYMVFRMTEILELTPEQAEKLFPLNRPYRDSKHALHMQMNALSEEVYQKEEISRQDLDKYKKEIDRLHQEEAKLDEEFITQAETFLEPQQVAKLIFFEPRFRKELSKELQQRYMPGKDEKKGKKKFWEKRK